MHLYLSVLFFPDVTQLFYPQHQHSKRVHWRNGLRSGSPSPGISPCLPWSVNMYCMCTCSICSARDVSHSHSRVSPRCCFQKWHLSSQQSPYVDTPGLRSCKTNRQPHQEVRAGNHVYFIVQGLFKKKVLQEKCLILKCYVFQVKNVFDIKYACLIYNIIWCFFQLSLM